MRQDMELQGVAVIYVPRNIWKLVSSKDWKANSEDHTETITDDTWIDESSYESDNEYAERIPVSTEYGLARFSLPVREDTLKLVQRFQDYMYKKAKIEQRAHLYRRIGRAMIHSRTSHQRKSIDKIDLGLLWFISTIGCRHRLILSYLGYPEVFNDSDQKSWCCDNCARDKGWDPSTTFTADISLSESALFGQSEDVFKKKVNTLPLIRP